MEVASTPEEKEAWLKEFHPGVTFNPISSSYQGDSNLNELTSIMGERVVSEILTYLYNNTGVERSFLKRLYGESSEKVLEKVYRLGILIENGDNVKMDTDGLSNVNLFSEFLSSSVKNTQKLAEETNAYTLTYYVGNFNAQGISKAKNKLVEAHKEIKQIEEDYSGNIVMEYGSNFTPLNSNEAQKINRG